MCNILICNDKNWKVPVLRTMAFWSAGCLSRWVICPNPFVTVALKAVKADLAGIVPRVRGVFPDLWTTLASIGRWTGGNGGSILLVVRGTGILPLLSGVRARFPQSEKICRFFPVPVSSMEGERGSRTGEGKRSRGWYRSIARWEGNSVERR